MICGNSALWTGVCVSVLSKTPADECLTLLETFGLFASNQI